MTARRMRRRARRLAVVGVGLVAGVLAFAAVLPAVADLIAPDTPLVTEEAP